MPASVASSAWRRSSPAGQRARGVGGSEECRARATASGRDRCARLRPSSRQLPLAAHPSPGCCRRTWRAASRQTAGGWAGGWAGGGARRVRRCAGVRQAGRRRRQPDQLGGARGRARRGCRSEPSSPPGLAPVPRRRRRAPGRGRSGGAGRQRQRTRGCRPRCRPWPRPARHEVEQPRADECMQSDRLFKGRGCRPRCRPWPRPAAWGRMGQTWMTDRGQEGAGHGVGPGHVLPAVQRRAVSREACMVPGCAGRGSDPNACMRARRRHVPAPPRPAKSPAPHPFSATPYIFSPGFHQRGRGRCNPAPPRPPPSCRGRPAGAAQAGRHAGSGAVQRPCSAAAQRTRSAACCAARTCTGGPPTAARAPDAAEQAQPQTGAQAATAARPTHLRVRLHRVGRDGQHPDALGLVLLGQLGHGGLEVHHKGAAGERGKLRRVTGVAGLRSTTEGLQGSGASSGAWQARRA